MSFHIRLTTFQQIRTFVALAARQPFEVRVGNDRQIINAKHLMGMICLDYSRPINVQADCTADEGAAFYQDALALQG